MLLTALSSLSLSVLLILVSFREGHQENIWALFMYCLTQGISTADFSAFQ